MLLNSLRIEDRILDSMVDFPNMELPPDAFYSEQTCYQELEVDRIMRSTLKISAVVMPWVLKVFHPSSVDECDN